ncbi:group III truncated hemoglobin [Chitinophaga lutea]
MKQDIENRTDIELLVNTFYAKVQQDDLLGPVFADRIAPDAWGPHLETMYRFWGTQLLGTMDYAGRPFPKHRPLPINDTHFTRWVQLFHATVDELFAGPRASTAKVKAFSIAEVFMNKLLFERGGRF